jgi:hypothetical protein
MPGLSRSGNWNENNLNPLSRINWRASLVPAAAVIPAPIAYIKVVAVKKLVVGFVVTLAVQFWYYRVLPSLGGICVALSCRAEDAHRLLWKNQRVQSRLMPLNVLAWNNKIGPWYYFVGLRTEVMINRDSWGYSYSIVRGEILGFLEDELLRKHLPRMFSLIKNES